MVGITDIQLELHNKARIHVCSMSRRRMAALTSCIDSSSAVMM